MATRIATFSLVAFAACGGGSPSAGGDGGVGNSDTAVNGPVNDGSMPNQQDTGSACTATSTAVLANSPNELSNLGATADKIVFLSSNLDLTVVPTIEMIGIDGTGQQTLHAPTGRRRVHALWPQGTDVFFLEQDGAAGDPVEELFRQPIAGGNAVRLGTATYRSGRFFGSDAGHVYLARQNGALSGYLFLRIDTATGAVETAATALNIPKPSRMQMVGDDVYFVSSTPAGAAGSQSVFHFSRSATNATPTVVFTPEPTGPCYLGLGGIGATAQKLACGYSGVVVAGRDGSSPQTLITSQLPSPSHVVVATADEFLYLLDGSSTPQRISKLSTAGGAATPVACGVGIVANRMVDGFFPIQNEYEVMVAAGQIMWIEKSSRVSPVKWSIRRAAK